MPPGRRAGELRWEEAISELAKKFGTMATPVMHDMNELYRQAQRLNVSVLGGLPQGETKCTDTDWKTAARAVSPVVHALGKDLMPSLLSAGKDREARVTLFIELCRRLRSITAFAKEADDALRTALSRICTSLLLSTALREVKMTKNVIRNGFYSAWVILLACSRGEWAAATGIARPLFVEAFMGTKCAGNEPEDPLSLFNEFSGYHAAMMSEHARTRAASAAATDDGPPASPDAAPAKKKARRKRASEKSPKRRRGITKAAPAPASSQPQPEPVLPPRPTGVPRYIRLHIIKD